MKPFYTTGEVAKICKIATKTVVNYCESGKIRFEQSPITNYRRIPRHELIRFITQFNIPVSQLSVVETKSVLVVDDDRVFVDIVVSALEKHFSQRPLECKARKAYDGYTALIEIGKEQPDIVILDILMPRLDGFAVCRILKENPLTNHIKICAVSAKSDDETRDGILKAGADEFLSKPFKLDYLCEVVEKLCDVVPVSQI